MDPDKFLERKPKLPGAPKDSHSRVQERRVAARLKGRVQPGSGAGRPPVRPGGASRVRVGGRGDVPTDLLLIECKITEKASASLKQEHLIKITRESAQQMKSPAMVHSFPVMPDGVETDWITMPLGVWEQVSERAARRRNPDA